VLLDLTGDLEEEEQEEQEEDLKGRDFC